MKVKIVAYLEVDPEKWAAEYGLPLREVRQDVKNAAEVCLEDAYPGTSGLWKVT